MSQSKCIAFIASFNDAAEFTFSHHLILISDYLSTLKIDIQFQNRGEYEAIQTHIWCVTT